jgi:membrane fusion protein (multidrug efflux system)
MNLRHTLFIALPAFLVLTACGSSERKIKAEDAQKKGAGARPPVRSDAFVVTTTTLFDNIEVPGTLVANEATEVHPEVAGRITGIYFKEGSYVGRGALLVKLNDADLRAQRQKLAIQLRVAQNNSSRAEELMKIQGISRQEYEAATLQVSNINADLAVINTQIEKTNIRAPFSGKVGLRMVSLGAYISPQSTITTIGQTSQNKIDFTIPEQYISRIKNGQYVNFKVAGSDRNYTARVIASDPQLAEATRTLQVRAAVVGDQVGLVPGNFAKVILNFEPNTTAIVVPSQAIIPQARGKKVYVLDNGTAKSVDVTTGLRDSANVQILTGLNPGDTVLVTGLLSLKPDAKVKLGKIINAPKGSQQKAGSTKTTAGQNNKS